MGTNIGRENVSNTQIEINPLTGLYYDRSFLDKADEILRNIEPNAYILVAIDIEHFKLFNKLCGREEGDQLLLFIADSILRIQNKYHGVAGYFGGDNFALLMPDVPEILSQLQADIAEKAGRLSDTVGFLPAFGVVQITESTVSAVTLYDRATIALSHVFGNYARRICFYDDSMVEKMEEELILISEVKKGLQNHEFTFYAQPQCDISTGKIVGAESLVRWKHSENEIIPPGVFIPVLEKNGFIADLDKFVWEEVCKWLKSWIDQGFLPVPISVNISRVDIYSMNVPAYIIGLVRKYQLPANLLKIEITETAYAEDSDRIREAVKRLQDAGFYVMMDDFGSGYSSLNMLKSVAVDVLKMDMRFLHMSEKESNKGIGILESVVNMSRQMGLPIIVEGVETKKQEDFLLGMGCRYAQGYYYYKPMPVTDFEKLLLETANLDISGLWSRQVEAFHTREFLDSSMFSDTMLNNIIGAAAFYDVYQGKIEITRANEQYFRLSGSKNDYSKKIWEHIMASDRSMMLSIFEQAYENPVNGGKGYIRYLRADGKVLRVFVHIFFLREREGHRLFYGSLDDRTEQNEEYDWQDHLKEAAENLTEEQRQQIGREFDDFPCGFLIARVEKQGQMGLQDYKMVYFNREMDRICGNSLNQLCRLEKNMFDEDKVQLAKKCHEAAYEGIASQYTAFGPFSKRYFMFTVYQYQYGFAGLLLRDISLKYDIEHCLRGTLAAYKEVYYVNLDENSYQMIYPDPDRQIERGNYEEGITRHFGTGKILKQDEENIRRVLSIDGLRRALASKDVTEYRYRRLKDDRVSCDCSEDEWCLTTVTVCDRVDGVPKHVVLMIREWQTFSNCSLSDQ